MQLYVVSASGDSNLVLLILQKHLKLLVEVKCAVPSKVALTPCKLAELFLQAYYVLQILCISCWPNMPLLLHGLQQVLILQVTHCWY